MTTTCALLAHGALVHAWRGQPWRAAGFAFASGVLVGPAIVVREVRRQWL